jgi:F-box and WD-40 domain protein CDC4
VTTLQFDENFLVTGGNDGRVRLFETKTGKYVRDLTELAESVCKVGYVGNVCAIVCRRARKTVMEVWSHDPPEVELERAW